MSGGHREDYDALTASRIARSRFLQERSSSRRSVGVTDTASTGTAPTVVRTAGRFSVPSDDIVLSPTRRRKTTAEPPAKPHTAPDATPSPRAARASIPDKSFWPAVDPEGHPVRWQIRDPFVFDIGPASQEQLGSRTASTETHEQAVRRGRSRSQKRGRSTSRKPAKSVSRTPVAAVTSDTQRVRKSPRPKSARAKRSSEGPTVVYHWRRIFFALALFAAIISGSLHQESRRKLHQIWDGSMGYIAPLSEAAIRRATIWVYGPTYCSSFDSDWDDPNCEPCPENAICEKGSLECKKPQFRKRWVYGRWICERDNVKYRAAERLLQRLADYLGGQNGCLQCGREVHPEAVHLAHPEHGPIAGLTLCSIEHLVIEWQRHDGEAIELADSARFLLLEELLLEENKCAAYGLQTGLARGADLPEAAISHRNGGSCHPEEFKSAARITLWYSTTAVKPISCIVIQSITVYLPIFFAVFVGFLIVRLLWDRWWSRRAAWKAIKRIVEENTSIRALAAGSGKGYAIGPRAQDILSMMRGPGGKQSWLEKFRFWQGAMQPLSEGRRVDKARSMSGDGMGRAYPEYAQLSLYLSEKDVEKFCEDLVKVDPSFCRSVLAMDMVPFYYSKVVIDKLRFDL